MTTRRHRRASCAVRKLPSGRRQAVGWQVRPLTASPHDPSTTERAVLELFGGHEEIWDELLVDLERRIARSETRYVEPL